MYTNNKRIISLLIISVLLNLILFSISHFLNLPLWLDTTGTIYISCILGAPAGFLVAIINNISEAIFFYGDQSLLFYIVSLVTAYVAGYITKKYYSFKIKKWLLMILALIIFEGIFAVIITLLVNNGIPSNHSSSILYYSLLSSGLSPFLATALAVLAIKIPDIIVTVLIVILLIQITPKKLKTKNEVIFESIKEIENYEH